MLNLSASPLSFQVASYTIHIKPIFVDCIVVDPAS